MVLNVVGNKSLHPFLVPRSNLRHAFRSALDTLVKPLLPPHSANRHDDGGRGAGADRCHVKMVSELSDHVWTIKELIERAAEA